MLLPLAALPEPGAALASQVVAQAEDEARHLGLLAVGAGLVLNGGHGGWGARSRTRRPAKSLSAAPPVVILGH